VLDEVRAYAAGTARRFIEGVSSGREGGATPPTREALFKGSAAPFLKQVWPQERSLNTPATSKAFAQLPAACGGEDFAAAVDAVERFLVPFECWSLIEYGLLSVTFAGWVITHSRIASLVHEVGQSVPSDVRPLITGACPSSRDEADARSARTPG